MKLVAALLVLVVASALTNGYPSAVWGVHGRFQGLGLWVVWVLAGVAGSLFLRTSIRMLARVLVVAAGVQSLLVAVQVATDRDALGTIGNGVLLGGWLAVVVAVSVASWRTERGLWRAAALAVAVMGTLAVGMTTSRGAMAGLFVGALVALLVGAVKLRRILLVPGLALVLLAALVVGGPSALGKLSRADLATGSAASRLLIWQGTLTMIRDHPLFGVGPGRFLYEYPRYDPEQRVRIEPERRADQAHSIYLHTASECGVPVAVAYLGLLGVAFTRGLRAAGRGDGGALVAVAGLGAFAGQAVFGISTVETDALAWVFGGVCVVSSWRSEEASAGSVRDAGDGVGWVPRATLIAASCATIAALAWFVVADVAFARATKEYASGGFYAAGVAASRAVALNPLVDVYRVAQADALAMRLVVGPSPSQAEYDEILASLEAGLALEPASYDLALARARLIGRGGAAPAAVSEAYRRAVDLWPLGRTVRIEAMIAALAAGELDDARRLARGVLSIYPDDSLALATLREVGDE